MRAIFLVLIIAVVALIIAVLTGMVNFRQTEPAVAPGIAAENGKIIARPGQAPAFDIETGSIGIGTGNASIAVPKVEIKPGDTRISVPSVEVRRPGSATAAPATPAAPAAPAVPPAPTAPASPATPAQ